MCAHMHVHVHTCAYLCINMHICMHVVTYVLFNNTVDSSNTTVLYDYMEGNGCDVI
jgi:hypothetical protein